MRMMNDVDTIKKLHDAAEDLLQLWNDKIQDIEMVKGFKEQWVGIGSFHKGQECDNEIKQAQDAIVQIKRSYGFIMKQIIDICEK